MKKILFLIFGLLSILSASADNFKEVEGSFHGIYPQFTIDNQQLLYIDDYVDGVQSFKVYDSDFNEIKTLNIEEIEYTYQSSYQVRREIPVGITPVGENSYIVEENMTEAEADAYVNNYYVISPENIKIIDGVKYYYDTFFYDNIKYPQAFFKYVDGTLYHCEIYYDCTTYLPVGEWSEEYFDINSRSWSALNLYPVDFTYEIDAYATLTQTLFNKDENFEYILPLFEFKTFTVETTIEQDSYYDRYSDEEWYDEYKDVVFRKQTYKNLPIMTGFKVMSDNGTTVQTVNFPSGYCQLYKDSPDLFILNDKVYIEFCDLLKDSELGDDERTYTTLLYQVEGNGAGIKAPQIFKTSVKVNPTNLHRSQNVKVTLNNPVNKSCKVNVVSSNGNTVYSTNIPAGCNTTEINTSSFASGVYVVMVQDGDFLRENCKIIVR